MDIQHLPMFCWRGGGLLGRRGSSIRSRLAWLMISKAPRRRGIFFGRGGVCVDELYKMMVWAPTSASLAAALERLSAQPFGGQLGQRSWASIGLRCARCVLPMVRFTGHNYPKGLGVLGLVLLSLKRGHMLDSSPAYPFSVKHIIVIVLARGAGLLGTPPPMF